MINYIDLVVLGIKDNHEFVAIFYEDTCKSGLHKGICYTLYQEIPFSKYQINHFLSENLVKCKFIFEGG